MVSSYSPIQPFHQEKMTTSKIEALETLVRTLAAKITDLESQRSLGVTDDVNLSPPESLMNSGDTAWMLAATALVLFMTLPGLALYYSGMVRVKNVLATVMQSFSITCLITVLWLWYGYSLSFGPAVAPKDKITTIGTRFHESSSPLFGDGSRLWLRGMRSDAAHQLAPTIPEPIFCAYQLTFAIITPALICGSFADRMKFIPMLIFMIIWHTIVYCPIAHATWHPDGFLFQLGCLDFAGGNVVHIASGTAGLVSTYVVGNRRGFGKSRFEPHNILLTFMGTSMLWVGWFGFNGGSAYAANGRAAMALLVTHISTAVAALSWLAVEWAIRKQPSVLGMVSGAVAGLVCITPASGFVDPVGAFFIGLFGGPLCYFGAQLKHYLGYDDALDAFGVHAIGGIVGGIATGFFATRGVVMAGSGTIPGNYDGVYYAGLKVGGTQLGAQIAGILFSLAWSGFISFFILYAIDVTIGLRVSAEEEDLGLDASIHGESIVAETDFLDTNSFVENIKYEETRNASVPKVDSSSASENSTLVTATSKSLEIA